MSSIKDKLKNQSKTKLAVTTGSNGLSMTQTSVTTSDIDKITYQIKSNLDEIRDIQQWWENKKSRVTELKIVIVEQLIYVRDNKRTLLKGITFEEYLTQEIGISKGYFYDTVRALQIANEYKKPELIHSADPKVILMSQNFEDKNVQKALIDRADKLSRADMKSLYSQGNISPEYIKSYIPIADRPCMVQISKNTVMVKSNEPEVIDKIVEFLKKKQLRLKSTASTPRRTF